MSDEEDSTAAASDAGAEAADQSPTAVNPQILDAVDKSTGFAFGLAHQLLQAGGSSRLSSGAAVAFEKVAQATALAVQDATDYQRNVLSISNVAQGKALAMMFVDKQNIPKYAEILGFAIVSAAAAVFVAGEAGTKAAATLNGFPRG